jgi:hypothetical protein
MTVEQMLYREPPTQAALDDLQGVIGRRYPAARFAVAQGDDPEGFYLTVTVDVADVDEVVDRELLDRLFEIQVEQGLPVYVIPLQPIERVLAEMVIRQERSLPKAERPLPWM